MECLCERPLKRAVYFPALKHFSLYKVSEYYCKALKLSTAAVTFTTLCKNGEINRVFIQCFHTVLWLAGLEVILFEGVPSSQKHENISDNHITLDSTALSWAPNLQNPSSEYWEWGLISSRGASYLSALVMGGLLNISKGGIKERFIISRVGNEADVSHSEPSVDSSFSRQS